MARMEIKCDTIEADNGEFQVYEGESGMLACPSCIGTLISRRLILEMKTNPTPNPEKWTNVGGKVVRGDTCSSLYGSRYRVVKK